MDSHAALHATLNRETAALRAQYRGPLLALVEAAGGADALRPHLALLRDAPSCDVAPAAAADPPHARWQVAAVTAALSRLFRFRPWLAERIVAAR